MSHSVIKGLGAAVALISANSVVYAVDPVLRADAQNINAACSSDAATASCGNEKVGTGLLKCLQVYKESNPTYKFSDGCKAAMKQMNADWKARKQ